jgi:hypothetical protein
MSTDVQDLWPAWIVEACVNLPTEADVIARQRELYAQAVAEYINTRIKPAIAGWTETPPTQAELEFIDSRPRPYLGQ